MYQALKQAFASYYGKQPSYIFTSPGRTELGGNHTDHQNGMVIAASINLLAAAAVSPNEENVVRICSEKFGAMEIDLSDLSPVSAEVGTSDAIVRGIAHRLTELGYTVCGFDAYTHSDVLSGSGLSSSAAFENLIGVIWNSLCSCGLSAVDIAQISQYAENVYFGKPCGLMDQLASAHGGIVAIDFEDTHSPVVTPIEFDFKTAGYDLCVIDCGADHADLTDEYAAITQELKAVCAFFGKERLRQVDEATFYDRLAECRRLVGDRAALRAIHVYEENRRVRQQITALQNGRMDEFLDLIRQSGRSSWMLLQNIIPCGQTEHQELAFVLTLAEQLLSEKGACRVHGGGFAGTLQVFVPCDETARFIEKMEAVIGEKRCHLLRIHHTGSGLAEVCE